MVLLRAREIHPCATNCLWWDNTSPAYPGVGWKGWKQRLTHSRLYQGECCNSLVRRIINCHWPDGIRALLLTHWWCRSTRRSYTMWPNIPPFLLGNVVCSFSSNYIERPLRNWYGIRSERISQLQREMVAKRHPVASASTPDSRVGCRIVRIQMLVGFLSIFDDVFIPHHMKTFKAVTADLISNYDIALDSSGLVNWSHPAHTRCWCLDASVWCQRSHSVRSLPRLLNRSWISGDNHETIAAQVSWLD